MTNTTKLYPLTFKTIFKEKIWGGDKIKTLLKKDVGTLPNCGETWELSGVEGNISIVANGALAGCDLSSLIKELKGNLVGEKVYQQYGAEFPLLVKFIDANADLSIQVHPNDELAQKRHNCKGTTEMWYVLQADKGAKLIAGFNQPMSQEKYLKHFNEKKLEEILNFEEVHEGDAFFMPSGRVHSIGSGVMLIEVQQTSDITYRIYDYNRTDADGNQRELHTEQALAAIDYQYYEAYKTPYSAEKNKRNTLVECPFFSTNILLLDRKIDFDYSQRDSFTLLSVVEGKGRLIAEDFEIEVKLGDVLLIPAAFNHFKIQAKDTIKILEAFIP